MQTFDLLQQQLKNDPEETQAHRGGPGLITQRSVQHRSNYYYYYYYPSTILIHRAGGAARSTRPSHLWHCDLCSVYSITISCSSGEVPHTHRLAVVAMFSLYTLKRRQYLCLVVVMFSFFILDAFFFLLFF